MELGRSPQAKKINPDEFSSYAAQLFYPQKDVPYKYYQEDADDFLTYLLNEVTQSNFDKNHLLYNFFKVPQSKRTKCLGCNQSSFYKQAEFVLKIEIPDSKEKRPLTDCLSDFCAEQKLEGHEQYQCKNCISKQDALTCIKFNELSPLLIIQLKRFEFDKKEGKSSKKLTEVTFNPDALDMTPYLFSELEHEEVKQVDKNNYELVGVVLHRGTLEFGHYISFVRYPHENSQWIKCNDNKVTLKRDRTLNNLAKTGTYTDSHGFLFYPYLFFYQKKV
jgi:ubiquitin carboxyl-terminal hydrolase 22/27/51